MSSHASCSSFSEKRVPFSLFKREVKKKIDMTRTFLKSNLVSYMKV